MKIITICGSMKYKKEMMEVAERLALEGNCVITPIYLNKSKNEYADNDYEMLLNVHKKKISMSDAIFVVNVDNYIGDGTNIEIEYSKELNKEILYYSDMVL